MDPITRFYKNKYPSVDDTVVVKILERTEYGYNVQILEYAIQGFVTLAELSRKKRHRKKNIVKVGDIFPMNVILVEENKGVVNLSKKYITEEDIQVYLDKYRYLFNLYRLSREVYSAYNNTVQDTDLEYCMDNTMRQLIDNRQDVEPKDLLEMVLTDPSLLITGFPSEFTEKIIENIQSRVVKEDLTMYTLIRVTVLGGLETLKDVLGEYCTVVSSPIYKIAAQGQTEDVCKQQLVDICNKIEAVTKGKGLYSIHQEPTIENRGKISVKLLSIQAEENLLKN